MVAVAVVVASAFVVAGSASASSASPAAGPLASLGVVTIAVNGSVSNPSAPITHSGSSYVLTADFNGSLVVLANSVTINGNGHSINYTIGEPGGDGAAVTVMNSAGVLVEGFASTNATLGILLNNTTGALVQRNSVVGSYADIALRNSTTATITENDVTGAVKDGVLVEASSHVSVASNVGTRATIGFSVQNSSAVTVTGNSANGSAGTGIMIDFSRDVQATGNYLETNRTTGYSLYAQYDTDLTVTSNDAKGSYGGIDVVDSNGVSMTQNNASYAYDGIGFTTVVNGTISDNQAFDAQYGVWSEYSRNVRLDGNWVTHDRVALYDYEDTALEASNNTASWSNLTGEGVYSYSSYNVTFSHNNLSNAQEYGVYVDYVAAATVSGNDVSNAAFYAVYAYETFGTLTVVGNNLSESVASGSSEGVYSSYDYGPLVVTGNSIRNQEYGVSAEYDLGTVSVVGNDISNSTYSAVYFYEDYATLTVANNSLANASDYGVENYWQYGGADLSVTGNNIDHAGWAGVYDYEQAYSTAGLVVSNNTIRDAWYYAVYGYYLEGPISITGNNMTDSLEYGVYLDYSYYYPTAIIQNDISNAGYMGVYVEYGGTVTVSGNRIVNSSSDGIYLYSDYGADIVTGNALAYAQYTAIYEYGDAISATLADNNATHAAVYALDLEYVDTGPSATVLGNDFSSSGEVYVAYSHIATFAGNDLLNVGSIQFTYDTIFEFYHNSINSSAFSAISNTVAGITWNAPYPVGGNYWTGYAGRDLYSGVSQSSPGSDGIGDTPYTVGAATDAYPLMTAWVAAGVSFQESGLPAGTTWSVTLNGVTQTTVAGGRVSFAQINGAYTPFTFTVLSGDARYAASSPSGSGTETGRSQTIGIVFSPVESSVSFSETTLPTGDRWSVTLNGVTESSTAGTISFNETNGTFAYTVGAVRGYLPSPASGSVHVAGTAVALTVNFTAVHFTAEFFESGLPSGALWAVNLNGTTTTSTGSSITFPVDNGTYTFAVTVPAGYTVSEAAGSLTVAGGGQTVYLSAYANGTGGSTPPATATSSPPSSLLSWGLGAALAAALVLALVGWLLYFRRRRSPPTVPSSAGAPPGALGSGSTPTPEAAPSAGGSPRTGP